MLKKQQFDKHFYKLKRIKVIKEHVLIAKKGEGLFKISDQVSLKTI
jgi:hypothetical protein